MQRVLHALVRSLEVAHGVTGHRYVLHGQQLRIPRGCRVTLMGQGIATSIDGNMQSRLIEVEDGAALELQNVRLTRGNAPDNVRLCTPWHALLPSLSLPCISIMVLAW